MVTFFNKGCSDTNVEFEFFLILPKILQSDGIRMGLGNILITLVCSMYGKYMVVTLNKSQEWY